MEGSKRGRAGGVARRALGAALCAALAAAAAACDGARAQAPARTSPGCTPLPQAAGPPPSLVLVVLGSARYSHLGAGGYPRPTTPFLEALARRGLWFSNALGAASETLPALASILSGLPPGAHGLGAVRAAAGASAPLLQELPSLARCLAQAGYRTLARGNDPALGAAELASGFDDRVVDPQMSAAGMLDELARWLAHGRGGRERPARPFFALLHLADAQWPYLPRYEYYRAFERRGEAGFAREGYPERARAAGEDVLELLRRGSPVPQEQIDLMTDLYDAELRQLDDALSRLPELLQRQGVAATTAIAISADHGERLLEKGDLGHGGRLDYRVLHVPLLLAGPGLPRGQRETGLVRSLDLFPTLLGRAGLAAARALPGRDLLGPAAPPSAAALDSAFARGRSEEMVRSGSFTFYRRADGRAELFDLERDPKELRDRATGSPAHVRWLEGELGRWRALEGRLASALDEPASAVAGR